MPDPHIEIIARGILLWDGRILLCQNRDKGYYYLPGGHVDFGEAASRALERELREEGGIKGTAGECCLVAENAFETRRRRHHEINFVFHVALGSPPPDQIESQEPEIALEWVELAALVELDLRPLAIKAWLASGGGETSCPWICSIE